MEHRHQACSIWFNHRQRQVAEGAVCRPSAEVHSKEELRAEPRYIRKNKYLLFAKKIDRIHIVVGMWHSLVARIVRDDEAAGSNPVIPTIYSTHKDQPMGGSFSVFERL